jgi:hypothetical protein
MKIIGIVGLIGSGKNTVADMILEHRPGAEIDSFARSLKDAAAVIFGWPRHMLEGDTKESREWREQVDGWWANELGIPDFTPRFALQYLGTDVMRNHFHTDIWLMSLKRRVMQRSEYTVIADCRFKNELDFIRKMNGTLIRVDRGPRPEWYEIAKDANAGQRLAQELMETTYKDVHRSEWDWIGTPVQCIIPNNGSLEQLDTKVKNIVDSYISR